MTIHHIALFKSKDGVTQGQIDQFLDLGRGLVGKIPGLLTVQLGNGLNTAAPVSKGFDWALVVILRKREDLPVFEKHPAHTPIFALSQELFQDVLIFDFEDRE